MCVRGMSRGGQEAISGRARREISGLGTRGLDDATRPTAVHNSQPPSPGPPGELLIVAARCRCAVREESVVSQRSGPSAVGRRSLRRRREEVVSESSRGEGAPALSSSLPRDTAGVCRRVRGRGWKGTESSSSTVQRTEARCVMSELTSSGENNWHKETCPRACPCPDTKSAQQWHASTATHCVLPRYLRGLLGPDWVAWWEKGDKITTFRHGDWPAHPLARTLTSGLACQRRRHRPVVAWGKCLGRRVPKL